MPLITRNSQNANVKLGTTAQLSALTFTDGDLASDTTLNKVKVFNGVSLTEIGATSFSSSAVVSQSTTIGDFTTPSAIVATSPSATVEYLVIAGGGGGGEGGGAGGGGGGAGGFQTGSNYSVLSQTYTITVGTGGARSITNDRGVNGTNSIFDSITSIGGGAGGGYSNGPLTGGSGGAGAWDLVRTGAAGTAGQGFAGGNGSNTGGSLCGGGGGGSSSVGTNSVTTTRGNGGNGTASSITGSSVTYAGGGGGGGNSVATSGGVGGSGGGGTGAVGTTNGTNGSPNTGSGGGGAAGGSGGAGIGGNGGTGIVILRYLTSSISATGGTITTDGLYSIHSFTSSGSFVVTINGGAANAIDNNTATKWTSNSESNPNCYVDMGSALNLCAAAFYFDSTDTTNTEILIQSSADASTWTTRRTITESNLTNGAYNFYRFNIAGGARYIRFYGNSAGSTVLSIWEIKILKKTDAEIFNDLGILTITASDTALGPDGT